MTRSEILQIAKPILFNGEMVRAILDDRKTETRRVVKPQPKGVMYPKPLYMDEKFPRGWRDESLCDLFLPPYKPGDYLYVRETWAKQQGLYWHKAGLKLDDNGRAYGCVPPEKWHPSIHMPKEAARIFLQVTYVRAERMKEITLAGLQSEGIMPQGWISQYSAMTSGPEYFMRFRKLWDSTIKPENRELYSWAANPWVWVIQFERVMPE